MLWFTLWYNRKNITHPFTQISISYYFFFIRRHRLLLLGLLLVFLQFNETLFVQLTANSVLLTYQDLRDHKPHKTAELAFLLIAHASELTQDLLAKVAEGLIIEEVLVSVELNDVARQIEKNAPSPSIFWEALRVLKFVLLSFLILNFVVAEMSTSKEGLKIPSSQSQDGCYESVLPEVLNLILRDGEVSRIDFVLSVNSN